jgi:TonB-dependent receptor
MASHSGYYPNVPNPEHPARGNDVFDTLFFESPQLFTRNLAADVQNQLTGNQTFQEDITAYYVMGNVALGRLSILAGVRVERTKVDAEGALQVITPEERAQRAAFVGPLTEAEIIRRTTAEFGGRQSRGGDNQFVLPGVHFKYSPTRNLVARLSYATNIGRPSIGQLIPRTNVNYDTQTVSSSNPSLKPQTADNFDLSAEYYFEPAGMVSVGVFLKELKSFIYTAGGTTVPTGADNGFGGEYAGYTLTTQYNGGSAKIKGIEVNYSQQFTFLPGIWKGLGAYANYTRLSAEGNYGSGSAISLQPTPKIAGFNPTTGNVGLSYIRNKITLRAQATYRGRYLATFNVNESRLVYFKERLRVDLKSAYQVSRRLELYLDISNILPDLGGDNQDTGGRASNYGWHSPLWSFGANTRW